MSRKLILIPILLLVLSISFSYSINNTAGIDVGESTLDPLVETFEAHYKMTIEQVDVYFDQFVLRYKVQGYTEVRQGMSVIRNPKIYVLDENWNIIKEYREDRIGTKAFLLGVPGVILYVVFTIAGWV